MFDATGRVILSIDRRRVEKSLVLKKKGYGKHNFNRTSNGTFSFYFLEINIEQQKFYKVSLLPIPLARRCRGTG